MLPQFLAVRLVEAVVGVKPEDPVAAGVLDADVTGGCEGIDPGEVADLGPQQCRNLLRLVRRAGIDDDHFINKVGDRFEASSEVRFLVLDDHRQGNARFADHGWRYCGGLPAHGPLPKQFQSRFHHIGRKVPAKMLTNVLAACRTLDLRLVAVLEHVTQQPPQHRQIGFGQPRKIHRRRRRILADSAGRG